MDPRLQSIARNEALLREVNQQIERLSMQVAESGWTPGDQIEFCCECGRDCDRRVLLTLEEYDAEHEQRDRFVVVPEHVNPELERVVATKGRYVVVDKLPAAEPAVGADGLPASDS